MDVGTIFSVVTANMDSAAYAMASAAVATPQRDLSSNEDAKLNCNCERNQATARSTAVNAVVSNCVGFKWSTGAV